jgi:hypothetical protein
LVPAEVDVVGGGVVGSAPDVALPPNSGIATTMAAAPATAARRTLEKATRGLDMIYSWIF